MEIPFGLVENGKLHRAAFGNFPAIELAEYQEEKSEELVGSFVTAFARLEAKLKSIEEKIDSSSNKASFLSGLQNLKESIATHQGLGDYQSLLERIGRYESLLEDYVQKNRQKNTDIKRALLLELEAILGNVDIEEAFEQIKSLKQRWLKTGSPDPEVAEELNQKYEENLNQFFEKRKSHLEAKNLLKTARTEDYQRIIDEISGFTKRKEFGKTIDKVKALQQEWKETGRIPEEDFKKLNEVYWKVCQEYFDQFRTFQSERKKQKGQNEQEVIEKRESILSRLTELSEQWAGNTQKELDALRKDWKNAGTLTKKKFSEYQDRFVALADMVREQQFVLQMTQKKDRAFGKKNEPDQIKSLMQTVRNFLRRDEDELKSFTENMDKMHINKGSFVDMLESKLATQKSKVALKKEIMEKYRVKLNSLKG